MQPPYHSFWLVHAFGVAALLFAALFSEARDEMKPVFDGKDATRPRLGVRLVKIAKGFSEPTDIQFLPTSPGILFVLEKEGALKWVRLSDGKGGTFLRRKVLTGIEEGLLGMTFHPDFARNHKAYIHYNPEDDGPKRTRISELEVVLTQDGLPKEARAERVLLEVRQPYTNHKGGQLVFGPDRYLYVGLGDGGAGGDPHNNAQNPETLLGKMLRIDVDGRAAGKQYAVPKDNPFVGKPGYLPEIWALGLRNPWRYSFDPRGRLLAADVGQYAWEELSVVTRGGNYGWVHREGAHCFKPATGCRREGLIDPVLEYGREEGGTIIGGFVVTGKRAPELAGKYVFGDFVSGRLWATDLDFRRRFALGRWPLEVSTFGRDAAGDVYLADYSGGSIYRLE